MNKTIKNYGVKKDGTPRSAPGRKANSGNQIISFFVMPENGTYVRSRSLGRPSLSVLKARRQVTMDRGTEYDPNIHGTGEQLASDIVEIARLELENSRKQANKRVKKTDKGTTARVSASPVIVEELEPA